MSTSTYICIYNVPFMSSEIIHLIYSYISYFQCDNTECKNRPEAAQNHIVIMLLPELVLEWCLIIIEYYMFYLIINIGTLGQFETNADLNWPWDWFRSLCCVPVEKGLVMIWFAVGSVTNRDSVRCVVRVGKQCALFWEDASWIYVALNKWIKKQMDKIKETLT